MNKTISRYINRNILFPRFIDEAPEFGLGIIVVIPCYNETEICASVESIARCVPPQCEVEVIVSINAGKSSPDRVKIRNSDSAKQLSELTEKMPEWLQLFTIMNNELPDKKAGVGLGRKIGMDEAVHRFVSLKKADGVIVCFDADSQCEANYLCEIESHFKNVDLASASINYAHPIEGDEFAPEIYDAIVQYELHLRYFIRMQKRLRLPYAFHTVGSSMACTVAAYCAVGGMNQRKAGEDFYFIHKLVKYGKHSELNTTCVIPSPRISDRVPFGTGKAVGKMQESNEWQYYSYHPQSFRDLEELVINLPTIYENQKFDSYLPEGVRLFLDSINGASELDRILKNTSDYHSFQKMFWHWFDAFVLMKYLHFVRDWKYADIPVLEAVGIVERKNFDDAKQALIYYRSRSKTYC